MKELVTPAFAARSGSRSLQGQDLHLGRRMGQQYRSVPVLCRRSQDERLHERVQRGHRCDLRVQGILRRTPLCLRHLLLRWLLLSRHGLQCGHEGRLAEGDGDGTGRFSTRVRTRRAGSPRKRATMPSRIRPSTATTRSLRPSPSACRSRRPRASVRRLRMRPGGLVFELPTDGKRALFAKVVVSTEPNTAE